MSFAYQTGGCMAKPIPACVGVLLLSLSGSAFAQSSTRVFISGGPMLNQDMSWGGHTITNAGLSLGGGLEISEWTEIRVAVEIPPATTLISSYNIYNGMPPVAQERVTIHTRARNRTIAVMLGRRFPVAQRLELATSVDWSSSRRADTGQRTVTSLETGARVEEPQVHDSISWPGPVFAIGGMVAVSKHLSLVPEARLIWYPLAENGNAIVRMAVESRRTF
jgi:hypothetical protein